MPKKREVVYYKSDTGYSCMARRCKFEVSLDDIKNKKVGPNILQDHAHTHQALSVRVENSSPPIECEVIEI